MWTENTTWFSNEEGTKGNIKVGQLADSAVLDRDFFSVPADEIQHLKVVLTLVGGKPVYGAGDFAGLAPPPPPAMPDWSPVRTFARPRRDAARSALVPHCSNNFAHSSPGDKRHSQAVRPR
jgi:hypothetical protein